MAIFDIVKMANTDDWKKFYSNGKSVYRKVASSSMSWLVAHFQIFRRLMKGKFDACVL